MKKNYCLVWEWEIPKMTKLLRTMKLTVFILLASVVSVLANKTYSQTKTLNLNMGKATIKEVLSEIENQSEFYFMYSEKLVDVNRKVDVSFDQQKINTVLNSLFEGTDVKYTIKDRMIVLTAPEVFKTDIQAQTVQQNGLTGKVTDVSGQPMPGVTVVVKGTTQGTITDNNGVYSLKDFPGNATLVFSFVGMKTQEILVAGKTTLNVVLEEDSIGLDEVVAIGYGTVKKKDITGSVAIAPIKDMFKATAAPSFAAALGGRVAGVQASSVDGQPGAAVNITIRGAGSLTQSTSPLYVIDGFPVESFNPASLNPEEIESITVLKDASSTSIYGSRGANGVILLNTKRGIIGRPVVTFNVTSGYQSIPKFIPVMNPYDFLSYLVEKEPTLATTQQYFTDGKTLDDYKNAEGIDWQRLISQTGVINNYSVAIRGGDEKTLYSISGSVYDQTGVIINTGLKRYSGRITLDQKISDRVKVGITTNYSNVVQTGQVLNTAENSYSGGSPATYALTRAAAYQPIGANMTNEEFLNYTFTDFGITGGADFRTNPVQDLENQYVISKSILFETNGYLSFDITKKLNFKTTAGFRQNAGLNQQYNNSKTAQGNLANPNNPNGINGNISNSMDMIYSSESTLNYKNTFHNDHTLTGLALFSFNGQHTSANGFGAKLLPNESEGMDGLDEGINSSMTIWNSENTMASFAGRLDYDYKSKYLLTLSFRADGSSKFSAGNQWGYFPGGALAWNMHNENFFKGLFSAISSSKLRVSYGSNGNNRVSDFVTVPHLTQSLSGYSYSNAVPTPQIYIASVANILLQWEKVSTFDIGYEVGFLADRFRLEADLYRKNTDNLLLDASLPPTTGYSTATKNIGALRNDGLELTLNAVVVSTRSFNWTSNFNISFNRNKVMSLTRGQQNLGSNVEYVGQFGTNLYIAEVGKPSGMMVGYIFDGIYQYSDFDETAPGVYVLKPSVPANGMARNTIMPGDIKYKDLNGDGTMTAADITIIGRGQAIHTGGFSNNFTYKAFSLNVFLNWSYGNDIFNGNRLYLEGNSNRWNLTNQYASYANRWSPTNPNNEMYRAVGQGVIGVWSSRTVEDGSYLRVKTVTLSYSLPANLIKKVYLSDLTLNVSADNLYTWTKYSGLDPEVSTRNNVLTPGYDFSAYPKSPAFVFGLKASF